MRVAFVISTLDRCGPVNVLFDIVRNLADEIDARIFTLATEPIGSRISEFEDAGIPVSCVSRSRIVSMTAGRFFLRRALGQFKPDVVHAHGFRPYYLCQDMPYPTIATVHNCIFDDYVAAYGQRRATWMTRKELEALSHFDKVISCSESNAELLFGKYGLKTVPICNGVDQTKYQSIAKSDKAKLRIALGYDQGKVIFISTGGCSKRKGTLKLITAFHRANVGEQGELHVFGEGPDYEKCRSLKYEDVILHGFCTDVAPHLQCADFFISISKSEGMPLAVLEAISCGVRALLSDIPSHREIVKKSHSARLLTDLEEDLGKYLDISRLEEWGIQDSSGFSAIRMAKAYLKEYRTLFDINDRC